MNAILQQAEDRIRQIRCRDVQIVVMRGDSPVPDVEVSLDMQRHQFLFGCDAYRANTYDDPDWEKRYCELFGGLFNYATLPFYWGQYEPRQGKPQAERLGAMVRWCRELGATVKGHPLVWHEILPEWLSEEHDMERLIRGRIDGLMETFGDTVDFWDLFNEITVSERFENPMSHWIERMGKARAVAYAAQCVYDRRPDAQLLYNDFNLQPADLELLLRELREKDVRLAAVGLQSHMHQRLWTLEEAWDLCERYARYGWPLHFTELTVLSGRCKGPVDYRIGAPNSWLTEPGDLERQSAYTADLYTLLYSHPAVEAITWWDFPDGEWMGAPCGLVTREVEPKPVYRALRERIRRQWWSNERGQTDLDGCLNRRVFCGDYRITVRAPERSVQLEIPVPRAGRAPLELVIRL